MPASMKDQLAEVSAERDALVARLEGQPVEGLVAPPANDEGPAANVLEAINRVKRDLPGIGKTDRGTGVPYAFRGIETLTAHLQPLTAKHGLVIVPVQATELPSSYEYNTSTGSTWHQTNVHYRWAVYGPGGLQDVIFGETIGQGRDADDKGGSKAQTQAYKEFVVKLFVIGDKSSDPDQHSIEPQASGNDTNGRTFGTGQAPSEPVHQVDWQALGWAAAPISNNEERALARGMFEKAMKEVKVEFDKLPDATKAHLMADRKKMIGELPFSQAQVHTWEKMVDAALREFEGIPEGEGGDLFDGAAEVDPAESKNQAECEAYGWVWDEATKTCAPF